MKQEMELIDAVGGFNALNSLSNASRLGWDLSWEIDDIIEVTQKQQKRHQDEADKILKALGEPLEDNPTRYTVPPDKLEEYQEAMEELGKQKVTLEFEPLDFQKLKDSGIKVQGREMRALKKYFIQKPNTGKRVDKGLTKEEKEEIAAEVKEKVSKSKEAKMEKA